MYAAVRQNADLNADPKFVNLSDALDGLDGEQFVDTEHLLPSGNGVIADRLAGLIWK